MHTETKWNIKLIRSIYSSSIPFRFSKSLGGILGWCGRVIAISQLLEWLLPLNFIDHESMIIFFLFPSFSRLEHRI